MFCKWCGKKITNIGNPCPSCGKSQDALESGNGFWDLCDTKPEIPPVAPTDTAISGGKPNVKEGGVNNKKPENKRNKTIAKTLHILTLALLLLSLVLSCICLSKLGDSLVELTMLRAEIGGLENAVSDGFEEIAEYHASLIEEDNTEVTEETTQPSINEMLESNELLLFGTSKLEIGCYEIDSVPAQYVYTVSGELLEEEHSSVYWQMSIDAGDRWVTIGENMPYLLAGKNDGVIYRVVCVIDSDETATGYYVVADTTKVGGEDKVSQTSDEIDTTEDGGDQSQSEESTWEATTEQSETIETDPNEDGTPSVG